MKLRYLYEPSDKQKVQHPENTEKFRQDEFSFQLQKEIPAITIAAFDWAKNFIGRSEFSDPQTALTRDLPKETQLNGGEIGSTVARTTVEDNPILHGYPLIEKMNAALRKKCKDLGIVPAGLHADEDAVAYMAEHRPEILTGYFAHVHANPDRLTLTAIGDVYCAIDGALKAGSEKCVDTAKMRLVDEEVKRGIDRQVAFRSIAIPMTEQQFQYQNRPGSGEYYYPAIDGTITPRDGVTVLDLPSKDVRRVLIFTDGLQPKDCSNVWSIDDLSIVDAVYNERTALELILDGNWEQLEIEKIGR